MANLCTNIRPESTERFTWNGKTKTFSAFLSDLEFTGFDRIYPDACDVGLSLCNPNTKAEVVFYLSKEDRDAEGDLRFYELLPISESVKKHPGVTGVKVVLFND